MQDRVPALVALERVCDGEEETWTVSAEADGWSGGLATFWSVDGVYVESHRIPVVASAPDGTADTLWRELEIVHDWREADDDRATVFLCSQDVVTRFVLQQLDGQQADCRTEGDPSVLDGVEGVPSCGP